MFDPTSVGLRGPLADHGNRFWSALLDDGYSPLTAVNHLRLAADLSRWLYDHRLGLTGLSDEMVDSFLKNRKRRGYASYGTSPRYPRRTKRERARLALLRGPRPHRR